MYAEHPVVNACYSFQKNSKPHLSVLVAFPKIPERSNDRISERTAATRRGVELELVGESFVELPVLSAQGGGSPRQAPDGAACAGLLVEAVSDDVSARRGSKGFRSAEAWQSTRPSNGGGESGALV